MKYTIQILLLFAGLCLSSVVTSAAGEWQIEDVEVTPNYKQGMPDLSKYNEQALHLRLDDKYTQKGQVKLVRMFDQLSLSSFTAGERSIEWAKRQRSHPQAIVVSGGVVSLRDIYNTIADPRYIKKTKSKGYLLRLPLVIEGGALLIADDKDATELRLSLERGAFVSVAGDFLAKDIKITGWSEDKNQPAYFKKAKSFRPFIVAWDGGGIYMLRAVVESLGYEYSKSYGVSLSKFTTAAAKKITKRLAPATGWIMDSSFEDLYFGFYCYEAKDVVVLNNVYKNNIIYGIDPHDRSENLIIAGNEVYGTKKKHGIIASREVNNSWFINNNSHHNHLSGIVLDRACEHNVIANNEAHNNGADGITFYESGHNVVWNNHIHKNAHHGIRVRNSTHVIVNDNKVVMNGRVGILGVAEDLSHTDRDFVEDPYHISLGLDIFGGELTANGSGALRVDEPDLLKLSNVKVRFPLKPSNILFRGFLREKTQDVLTIFSQKEKVLVYRKNKTEGIDAHLSSRK